MGQSVSSKLSRKWPTLGGDLEELARGITRLPALDLPALRQRWAALFDARRSTVRADLLTDPQVTANHLIVESVHPHAGPMRQPRPAAGFAATPADLRLFAPPLGEHTDAVLEEAGIAAADRAALRDSGIIS